VSGVTEFKQQGFAAFILAGILAGLQATGGRLEQQTFLFLGAGEAGTGESFWCIFWYSSKMQLLCFLCCVARGRALECDW
jgi:hypothetical protein